MKMKTIFEEMVARKEEHAMDVVYRLLELVNFDKWKTPSWSIHHVCGGNGLELYFVMERSRYIIRLDKVGSEFKLSVSVNQPEVEQIFLSHLVKSLTSPIA